MYIATIGPYPDALDYWGAKNTAKILDDHEWWRFITPLFLHGYVRVVYYIIFEIEYSKLEHYSLLTILLLLLL